MSKFFDSSSPSTPPVPPTPLLHPLPDSWTMWYHYRVNIGGRRGENEDEETAETEDSTEAQSTMKKLESQYLKGTNRVSFPKTGTKDSTEDVSSVEQFWQAMSNLKSFAELPKGTEFLFFKNGVKPMWEDPANTKGGRWIFHFVRDKENSALRTGLVWERLLLRLISGTFIPQDNLYRGLLDKDICGVTLSVRGDRDIISIWNTHQEYYKYFAAEVRKYQEEAKRLREMMEDGDSDTSLVDDDILQDALNEDSYFGLEEDQDKFDTHARKELRNVVKLTPFALRRGIANAMFRLIAEVDKVVEYGENPLSVSVDSAEQVKGVCSKSKYKRHFYAGGSTAKPAQRGKNYTYNTENGGNNRRHKPHQKRGEEDTGAFSFRRRRHENEHRRQSHRTEWRSKEEPAESASAPSTAAPESFAALGKQRKQPEQEDGQEEVNMLSFSARRRRMMHMRKS